MSRNKSLLIPFIVTLAGLLILIGLGKWQLDRRVWKQGLIERIEARAHGEPISLVMARRLWERERDVEYYRVLLVGRFLHEHERHLFGVVDGQAGWRILTPFQVRTGDVVIVDRGIVPNVLKEPSTRVQGQITETLELIGLARAAEAKTAFTPDNQPAANRWFWRDTPALIASLPEPLASKAAPFTLEAEQESVPGGWPRAGVTRLALPNRHLEYALTWFGLAFALLCVFLAYAWLHLRRDASCKNESRKIADENANV